MANGNGVTSIAFVGLMLGAVLVYVLYRIITLEKQVREAALVQADKIRLLIDEQIESAIAAALIDEVSAAPPPPLPSHVKIASAHVRHGIHEVFNDISQFISQPPAAAMRPSKSNVTVEEIVESESPKLVKVPPPVAPTVPPAAPVVSPAAPTVQAVPPTAAQVAPSVPPDAPPSVPPAAPVVPAPPSVVAPPATVAA